MVKYTRLTFFEREEVSRQLASNASIRSISNKLKRSPSTISREINRCAVKKKYYRAVFAQQNSKKMLHKPNVHRKLDKNPKLRDLVFYYLLQKRWTPEQVAKRLKILYPNDMIMHISHESIYSYLYVLPRTTLKKKSSLRSGVIIHIVGLKNFVRNHVLLKTT